VPPVPFPCDPQAGFIKGDDLCFLQPPHRRRLERRRLDKTAFQDIEDRAAIQVIAIRSTNR
jgi:hypothetical protein